MSIKSLWDKQKQATLSVKTVQQQTVQDLFSEVESQEYVTQYQNSLNFYLQDVNFATASNFAKFGSARKYYENITTRITNYFPYDGSKASQLEFENNLNPFEKYIYLYQYPRSTGYVNFSPNGWGTRDSTSSSGIGLPTNLEYISFYNQNNDNIYSPENGLRENTRFIFASGSTIEFWLKKNAYADYTTQTSYETIFYMASTGSDNKDKALAVLLGTTASLQNQITVSYQINQNSTPSQQFSFNFDTGLATIADSQWHHYALTFYSSSAGYTSEFYLDGVYKSTQSNSNTIVDFTGSSFCTLGSLGGKLSTVNAPIGSAKLSGSIDEFRFWNTRRDAKQIGLNYFVNVGGGNNVSGNSGIGVYYKFNEGIVGDSTTDSVVLDYAGRNCNGLFVGYNTSSRNTGSAITNTQENPEIGTPILYYNNQNVQTFLTEQLYYADEYDFKNNFALKNSLPSWILDEDAKNGETLVNFLQSMASYLDTLHLQIKTSKDIKNKDYLTYKGKAPPFSDLLLTSEGFDLPSLFLNADIVQSLLNQDNRRTYDESINNLKNVIYKNIYNNLNIIYKSKGTENSIKQLLRTFGVNQDVFSLNIYANNTQYELQDSYVNKSLKKSYVDFTPFNYAQNSQAVIYQSGSNSFITGTNNNSLSFTAEYNFLAPEFPITYDYLAYKTLNWNTASLFGIRTASDTSSDISVYSTDPAALKVRMIYRDDKGYFALQCPTASLNLTSSVFSDITTNEHWNISVRLVPVSTGSSFNLIFSGYSNFAGQQFKEFSVSSSLTTAQGNTLLSNNKRIYVGAERDNITGSLQYPSLAKGLAVKYWADYLEDEELKERAKNPNNVGRSKPSDPYTLSTGSYLPKSETLLLHWDFTNVTSSDSNGNVNIVYDLTSGSVYSTSPINNLVGRVYNGAGYGFEENSTVGSIDLIYSSEQQLPENLYSNQLINILETDDNYTNVIRPQKYFFSIENSMYDTISKNILNLFSSIIEFNNFIGEPLNTYKTQYNKLKSFRKIFFDKIGNIPDLDSYVGVYKWIDDALDSILFNLLPASANASEKIRTVVENHMLERNKINYPLVPDKSVKSDGGIQVNTSNQKNPVYFVDPFVPSYKDDVGYTPPYGPFADNFLDTTTTLGQNKNNSFTRKRQVATKAARIGRRR